MRARGHGAVVKLCVVLSTLWPALVSAREAFVEELQPCLQTLRAKPSDPADAPGGRYHVMLGQGWVVSLFAINRNPDGNLAADICGGPAGSGWDINSPYQWPSKLGKRDMDVDLEMITPEWLDQMIRSARAARNTKAPIFRISITPLPNIGEVLVRVQFRKAQTRVNTGDSVDLNQQVEVINRDARVPDQFARAKRQLMGL
jgi:hypothetical protein